MGEKTEVARPRRVVLDTNVVLSVLVFREGRLAWLREAWEARKRKGAGAVKKVTAPKKVGVAGPRSGAETMAS